MNEKKHRSFIRAFSLGVLVLALALGTVFVLQTRIFGAQEPALEAAPMNPEFVRYLKDQQMGVSWLQYSESGHPLGLLPNPVDVFRLQSLPAYVQTEALPTTYDLRTKNKLTPIKNQGGCGSCWAFATYGSLESFLKPGAVWDFSEQNLIDHHGFDWTNCAGGNSYMSLAYLARWGGPLNESDDPYIYSNIGAASPSRHLQKAIYLPARTSATDNANIKNAVMTYGGVYVAMKWADSAYNSKKYAYYNANTDKGGHAVVIVGWNDSYPKTNFTKVPSGNGAFIVRNSWGTGWGDHGYFYVSYYDKYFARQESNCVFQAESATNYRTNYGYDTLGWVRGLGYSNPTAWFANIFTASASGSLQAVSFYAASATSNAYEISVYTNVLANKPTSGKKALTKKGTVTCCGYFTIPLGSLVSITKGQRFSVVVKLTTKNYNYPVTLEYPLSNYSSKAKAAKGQSFFSPTGISWTDACAWKANTNVCLKAFTKY